MVSQGASKMSFGDPRDSLTLQERMFKETTDLDNPKENLLLCLKTSSVETCVPVLLTV